MNIKRILTAAGALLATTALATPAGAAAKRPSPSGPVVLSDTASPPAADGWAVSSTNFTDVPYDSSDTEAADDFVLKRASTIQEVEVDGFVQPDHEPLQGGRSLGIR